MSIICHFLTERQQPLCSPGNSSSLFITMRNVAVQLNSLGKALGDYELLVEISGGEKGEDLY